VRRYKNEEQVGRTVANKEIRKFGWKKSVKSKKILSIGGDLKVGR
jgi:hypothetical protein